jgi:hypothetical protein
MDKINPGFPGPVAENLLGRDGKRSQSKRGPHSGGGPYSYEVAPVETILHEFNCPESSVTARRMTDFVSQFLRAG